MAMTFGKGNRSIAFNPTSAFPLDARGYFESYEAAVAAAAMAAMAGDTNTQYYFGQTVAVVENGIASLYIIQPNKTLAPFTIDDGSTIAVDANQFEFDENGKLMLKGAADAAPNSLVSIDENGALIWVDPIDTYTKTEIESLIANANHLKRKVVTSVDEIETYISNNADADQYIFMVPTGLQEDSDKYDEYMVVDGVVEKVGSWEVDLSDYAKTADVDDKLSKKVDAVEGYSLISAVNLQKLNDIEANAEKNYISSVTNDFLVTDGQLSLQNLNISKIVGLQDLLDAKVEKKEGWTLLSPTDQQKLSKLVVDGDSVAISGKVNVENVQGLEDWLNANAGKVVGLSEQNFTLAFKQKLDDLLFISSVNLDQLKVDEAGQLSIIQVDPDKVTGLQDALSARPTNTEVDAKINTSITDLNNLIQQTYVLKTDHQADIDKIWEVLTWQEIPTTT